MKVPTMIGECHHCVTVLDCVIALSSFVGAGDPSHPPPYRTTDSALEVSKAHNEPDLSNSKGRARNCHDASNSNTHDLLRSQLLGIESFVSVFSTSTLRICVISRKTNLVRNPHRPCPAAAVCECHVGQTCMSLLLPPHPGARTQYYSQFQHSHYPQASYGHYQPYIPPAQTQTPGPVTAAIQRQHAQTSQLDTADVATLNDAIGSAGVDLRVRAPPPSFIAPTLMILS